MNATISRQGDIAYLIVTHSIEQAIEFKIDCGDLIQSVEMVLGDGDPSLSDEQWIMGSFDGIDAHVYRINYR